MRSEGPYAGIGRPGTRLRRLALAGGIVALLALAPSASAATSVSGVTTQFTDGNFSIVTSPTAGVNYNYNVAFNATSGLAPNDTITVTGPPGTIFNPGLTVFFNVLVSGHSGSSSTGATITNGGRTITTTVPTLDFISPGYTVPAGGLVSVDFINLNMGGPTYVTSPTVAGQYTLSVATSKDTVAADSPPYTVGPDVAANMGIAGGSGQSTQAGTAFASPLRAAVSDQYGNAVPGQTVTFDAPGSGASGTFAGGTNGGREFVGTTGSNGVANAPVLTANTIAGGWTVSASGPNATGASFSLTTVPQAAAQVSLVLEHPSLPADGASETKATATVADQFGNPVSGENVLITSSDGGQFVDATTDAGSGHYSATITTSHASGVSTITATDSSVAPALTGTAQMTQLDVTGPAVKITGKPAKRFRAKTAKISFRSSATDLARFQCKLDKRSFATCTSPRTYSVAVGKHTISVRAVDQAGNIGPPVSASFRRLPPKRKHHHH